MERRRISDAERQLVEWNLGYFPTAESLTANNIILAVYDYVTAPECRQHLLRQAYEEAIHMDTFIYCCDSLGFDPEYLYGMSDRVPSIKENDEFVADLTRAIDKDGFTIETDEDLRNFLRDLVGFYVIVVGNILLRRIRNDARPEAPERDGRHRATVRVHHAWRITPPRLRRRPRQPDSA